MTEFEKQVAINQQQAEIIDDQLELNNKQEQEISQLKSTITELLSSPHGNQELGMLTEE